MLLDSMAGDGKVTGAARVSTGKGPEYVSKGPEADARLIAYLMAHGHGTPFEHSVFQFYVKAPIFVAREWQRHRVASYNEFSMRYAEVESSEAQFYTPDHVRVPDPGNKQGAVVNDDLSMRSALAVIDQANRQAFTAYQLLLTSGVAREMARVVLPVSTYTSFWFTVNARSLMNFLMLRADSAAQWEIRQYAYVLESFFGGAMPLTHRAFLDNGRKAP